MSASGAARAVGVALLWDDRARPIAGNTDIDDYNAVSAIRVR